MGTLLSLFLSLLCDLTSLSLCSGALEDQITSLKKQSETKLASLRNEVQQVEQDLEEVRYEASFVGGQSRDTYQKHKDLASSQQKLRRIKEKTETAEQLQQQVVAGLNHISDMLGVPERDENAPVHDVIKDIETVLETLVEEREKQLQGQQTANNAASIHSDSSGHRGMLTRAEGGAVRQTQRPLPFPSTLPTSLTLSSPLPHCLRVPRHTLVHRSWMRCCRSTSYQRRG
jgi:TolA-binding protein